MKKTITGAEFRDFYQNHWPRGFWHEDAEYEVEDENGAWVLPDDHVLHLDRMGYLVTGATGGEQTWRPFSEVWEAWLGEAPQVRVMTWRVPAELVEEVQAFMSERGIEQAGWPSDPSDRQFVSTPDQP